MTNKTAGWALFAASIGTMLILMGADVKSLTNLHDVWTPLFIGNMMAHAGNVVMAFVAGKLIPTTQDQRKDDQ